MHKHSLHMYVHVLDSQGVVLTIVMHHYADNK